MFMGWQVGKPATHVRAPVPHAGQRQGAASLEEELAGLDEPASQPRIETVEPDAIIPSGASSARSGALFFPEVARRGITG